MRKYYIGMRGVCVVVCDANAMCNNVDVDRPRSILLFSSKIVAHFTDIIRLYRCVLCVNSIRNNGLDGRNGRRARATRVDHFKSSE